MVAVRVWSGASLVLLTTNGLFAGHIIALVGSMGAKSECRSCAWLTTTGNYGVLLGDCQHPLCFGTCSRGRKPSSVPRITTHFATAIYRRALREDSVVLEQLNDELMVEAAQFADLDDEGRQWSEENYCGGYTSFASLRALHRMSSTFNQLERWVDCHVRTFAEYLEFDEDAVENLSMTDCWVNVMPEGTAHGLHLHPTSTISGTYYVQTPPKCAALRFEDPRFDRMMAAPRRRAEARPGNQLHVESPAVAGEVVLFESWLRHSVAANPLEEERVSVSFNYHWC